MIEWEEIDPASLPDTSNAPKYCEHGPFSHTWWYEVDYDGSSIWTEDCDQCSQVVNGEYGDMSEHLVGTFKVILEPRVERYSHPEGCDVDYFIDMLPVLEDGEWDDGSPV